MNNKRNPARLIKPWVIALLILPLLLGSCKKEPDTSIFDEITFTLVEELDVEKAVNMLEQVATEDKNRYTRARARNNLAFLSWRVYDRPEEARELLTELIEEDLNPFTDYLTLARIEIGEANFVAAQQAARSALARATGEDETEAASEVLAWAIVEQAITTKLAQSEADPEGRASLEASYPGQRILVEARDIARDLIDKRPGALRPAKLLLATSLLLADGPGALEGWRAYYWVTGGQYPVEQLVEAYGVLQVLLSQWAGPSATLSERETLVQALADSHFYDEAALVALEPDADQLLSFEANEIVAYARFLRRLSDRLDAHYREGLTSHPDAYAQKLFDDELERFCFEADCPHKEFRGSRRSYIEERFGTYWLTGRSDRRNLHLGHIIQDEEITVEQYGQTATVHFVSLDALVSHGVQSWLQDKLYFVGAFAQPDGIVEFRPFRVQLLLDKARLLLNKEARSAYEANMTADSEADWGRAEADPYAFLPGLQQRLLLRSLDALWSESATVEGSHTFAFLHTLNDVWLEGPGYAHEGRHIIDMRAGVSDNPTLEYSAKLAEMAFCRYPGISLGNILNPGVGHHGHGEANLKILQDLLSWMESHSSAIEGLDDDRPLLPQLDLLTDAQLHQAARDLDPLYASQQG